MDPNKIYVMLESPADHVLVSDARVRRLRRDHPADIDVRLILQSVPAELSNPGGPLFELEFELESDAAGGVSNNTTVCTKTGTQFNLGVCASFNLKVALGNVEWFVSNPIDFDHVVRNDVLVVMSKACVVQRMF